MKRKHELRYLLLIIATVTLLTGLQMFKNFKRHYVECNGWLVNPARQHQVKLFGRYYVNQDWLNDSRNYKSE